MIQGLFHSKGSPKGNAIILATTYPKAFPLGVDLTKNACIVSSETEEVVLLRESTQTSDTAGGPTSSDPTLRPAHLPLLPRLRQGKAFGRTSRYF